MSLKSWWKRATKIPTSPRGIIGNLVKNASPFLALTGVGALGAGGVGALGEVIRNKKATLGDIAKAGVTNAGLGKGLDKGVGIVQSATRSPVDALAAGPLPDVGLTPGAGVPASVATEATTTAAKSPGLLRSALSFAEKNPTAVGMGLNAASGLATAGAENRMTDAQTRLLDQRYEETEEDRRRRRELEAYLNQGLSLMPYTPAGTR